MGYVSMTRGDPLGPVARRCHGEPAYKPEVGVAIDVDGVDGGGGRRGPEPPATGAEPAGGRAVTPAWGAKSWWGQDHDGVRIMMKSGSRSWSQKGHNTRSWIACRNLLNVQK